MRSLNIAAVVLAAGFSRRLGRAKQAEVIDGESLLTRAIRTAQEAEFDPVLAVIAPDLEVADLPVHALLLRNHAAEEGMASSLRLGIQEAMHVGVLGTVVMTCDQPLLTAGHLRVLCADPARVTASMYAGRKGVPAYFPAAVFPELLALQGDVGARDLLREATAVVNEDLSLDIDTEEDLARACARLR